MHAGCKVMLRAGYMPSTPGELTIYLAWTGWPPVTSLVTAPGLTDAFLFPIPRAQSMLLKSVGCSAWEEVGLYNPMKPLAVVSWCRSFKCSQLNPVGPAGNHHDSPLQGFALLPLICPRRFEVAVLYFRQQGRTKQQFMPHHGCRQGV